MVSQIPDLTQYLREFLLPERYDLLTKVLKFRTRYITVVLEDIFQPQNASAVVRSCDCFGIHDLHIVESRNSYIIDREVAMGSDKWVNVVKYPTDEKNSYRVLNQLKEQGYRIVATSSKEKSSTLEDFNMEIGKVALFFGTELTGLSPMILDNADEFLQVPMYGFTESFNISVSVAIILHHLNLKLRNSTIDWQLTDSEKELILYHWVKASVKKVDLIIQKYCRQQGLDYNEIIQL